MKREIYLPYFENKKVTVMGLGLLGRGLGDTEFLAKNGAELIVTDKKTKEQLTLSLEALKKYEGLAFVFGEHRLEDFENRDFILKAAGVAYDNEYIAHAKSKNIPVYMSAALVCDIVMNNLPNVKIIGITGTRGKSTTTQMIAHILKSVDKKVHLGGNIRGVANLPLLDEIEDGDFLILELDSWQLQGFGDMKISPHIAVFTSFLDDHMNYYKNDKKLYFNDKANIYRYQKEMDVVIVSPQAKEEIKKRDENVEMIVAVNNHIETNLIGEHNQIAAKLSYEVASQCGLDDTAIREAITTFKAVEGRLEDMGFYKTNFINLDEIRGKDNVSSEVYKSYSERETEVFDKEVHQINKICKGVRVFNDNNGTTPDATIKALESLFSICYPHESGDPVSGLKTGIVLIIGGSDKGLPIDELEKNIKEKTKAVIYLSGTGTDRLNLTKDYEYEKLSDCVDKAFEIASEGDIILFSPAFASFSKYFNNEYEKNDEFVKSVQKYK